MLVEQFLHIMLNQDDPRFFVFSAANIYTKVSQVKIHKRDLT